MCIAPEHVQADCDLCLQHEKEDCMLTAYTGHDVLYTQISIELYTVLASTVNITQSAKMESTVSSL